MKTVAFFFLVTLGLVAGNMMAMTVYVSGTITDSQGNTKVPDHKVYIKTDFSSPFHYYKTTYTDANGFYADTVQNVPAYPVTFQISTYDCNNEIHIITNLSTNSPIVANFQICVPPYSGCRADFTYDSISGVDYRFTDHSVSNSTIISWTWNFGDPASLGNDISHLQNPQHQYTSSGIYNVKLLTVSANGCQDSLVKTVFIRIQENRVIIFGHITNEQTNGPIPNNPVMINTTLIEYSNVVYSDVNGAYADTIAAVPNGIPISVATYDCNNVLHSNTVFSAPASIEVDFSICLNAQCRAGFMAVLDSGNTAQNKYLFQDQSYGDPNKWTWNFGDGNLSHEQNPTHQFTSSGSFMVTLTITKEDSTGGWNCVDSVKSAIKTSNYYNFGGLVFAGHFPINNPNNTGDTGVAFLYRAHHQWIVAVDTALFTNLGYYTFLHVLEGNYIVKAGLTKGSVHYKDYLPAYNGDHVKWQMTPSFLLDHNIFDNSIHLFAANDSLSGFARINGAVVHKDDNKMLTEAEVLMFDHNLIPIRSALTDFQGNFEFASLPYGTYNLYPEVTGKYARILQIIVDAIHPTADGLLLAVYDHDVTGVATVLGISDIIIGKAYPNPVTDQVQLWMITPEAKTIDVEVITITGEPVVSKTIRLSGKGLMTLPMTSASSGLYFLVIKSGDGRILNTQKIIKN